MLYLSYPFPQHPSCNYEVNVNNVRYLEPFVSQPLLCKCSNLIEMNEEATFFDTVVIVAYSYLVALLLHRF